MNIIIILFLAAFDSLDAPVERITGVDVPMPYAINLEKACLPQVDNIINACRKTMFRKK
jgi:pyruvate dehydrogenase E1 component beta subunit